MENGVLLNPTTGNIIASGNIQANSVSVPSDERLTVGETNLKDYVKIHGGTPTAPSTEADESALAGARSTAEFVNSSINAFAAFYLTKDAYGNAFASKAELLNATVFYNGGETRTPTKNDYCIVLQDEDHPTALGNPTTRYSYQGPYPYGNWDYQYIVNNTALTQAQINAINSGITQQKVAQIDNAATQEYVDSEISAKASRFLGIYQGRQPTPRFTRTGDFYSRISMSNSAPHSVQIPGRPTGDKSSLLFYSTTRAEDYNPSTTVFNTTDMEITSTDAFENFTLSGSNVQWKPINAMGTLFSEWLYSDTLSARAMISANVKSPFVQKNQLSNVNVLTGKYEDGTTFEISCLGTM